MRFQHQNCHDKFDAEIKRLELSIKAYRQGVLLPGELILHIIMDAGEMQRCFVSNFHANEKLEESKPQLCLHCGEETNMRNGYCIRCLPVWGKEKKVQDGTVS